MTLSAYRLRMAAAPRMPLEAQAAREAKVARRQSLHCLTTTLRGQPRMRLFDPEATGYFWQPHATWLMVEDFFMSDAEPLPPGCHNYWLVETGQKCCVCGERVRSVWSGIACPCGHTWFCA